MSLQSVEDTQDLVASSSSRQVAVQVHGHPCHPGPVPSLKQANGLGELSDARQQEWEDILSRLVARSIHNQAGRQGVASPPAGERTRRLPRDGPPRLLLPTVAPPEHKFMAKARPKRETRGRDMDTRLDLGGPASAVGGSRRGAGGLLHLRAPA